MSLIPIIIKKTDMNSSLFKNTILSVPKIIQHEVGCSKFLSVPQLIHQLACDKTKFAVEISKENPFIIDRSVWVGNRLAGMSTWLSLISYQLTYSNFYLYVDKSTVDDENCLEYLDSFYKRMFYKNYLGLCAGNRSQFPTTQLHKVRSFVANKFSNIIQNHPKILLIDVRGSEQARKSPVCYFGSSIQYCNIPLDHEQLNEQFKQKLMELPQDVLLITMCAKGFRATIAYSLFRHLMKNNPRKMFVCQSSLEEINNALQKLNNRKVYSSNHAD